MLLVSAFQKSTVSKTRAALARKCPPGSRGGVSRLTISLVCEPMMNDHHSGIAEPSTNAVSRP